MKEKLRAEYQRLLMPDNLNAIMDAHKLITDVGFNILVKHGNDGANNRIDHDGNLLFQMTLMKSLSIRQLTTAINYMNDIDRCSLSNVYDPFTMDNIVRTQYEAFCNFNNIYVQPLRREEKQLKYLLWVISGLKYRQRQKVDTSEGNENREAHSRKKEEEAKQIETLTENVKSNTCFLQLSDQSKTKILDGIQRKDWQFKVDGSEAHKVAWHQMLTNAGGNDLFDGQYSFLSLNTHPSNVSVFQFGSMYINNMHEFNTKMAIQMSTIITAMFIRDYLTYFAAYIEVFNKAPVINQMLINSYNRIFRSESYEINDINNLLN